MQTLNNAELAFLSILAYPELTAKTLRLYANHTTLFTTTFCPHLYQMWSSYLDVIKRHKKQYGLKISADLIAAGISESIQADENMPEELVAKCDYILQRLIKNDVPTKEEGSELIQKMVQLDVNRKISYKVTMNADILELQQTLDASKRVMSDFDAPVDIQRDKIVYNPFREIDTLAVHAQRIPTGINWLDDVTSGGGREGELWLVLGSSGGGKTALAVQYACAQALMGNSTLWATYEQSLEGDVAERIIACVTDESLDKIRDIGFNNLDKDIQRKFWAAVAGADEKLTVLDMTKVRLDVTSDPSDNGGMYSVWKQYKELKAKGVRVKTIIIDWVGAMMSLVGSITGKDLSKGFRFFTQAEIDIARRMVKEEGIQIIFFHQTDSQSQHAKPVYVPDKTCAKDMKDMCNYMDIVLTLGIRDVNNVCWFNAAKSRKGAAIKKTIQLIGDKSRFINADGWLPNRDGNFYKPGDSYMNDLPSATNEDAAASYSREIE